MSPFCSRDLIHILFFILHYPFASNQRCTLLKKVYNINSSFANTNNLNLNHILLSDKAVLDIKCS